MARQGTIVAFDDAKANAEKARPSVAAQKSSSKPNQKSPTKIVVKPSAKATQKPSVKVVQKPSAKATPKASAKKTTKRTSIGKSGSIAKSGSIGKSGPIAKSGSIGKSGPIAKSGSIVKKTARNSSSTSNRSKAKSSRANTNKSPNAKASTKTKVDQELQKNSSMSEAIKKDSRLAKAKKTRAKEKASKEFTKQFGETSSSASSTGPRAAVYKAEMGRQHKKMTQMQGAPKGLNPFKRISLSGFDWRNSPKVIASIMIVVCLFASGAFLYPSAKQYYLAVREHDQLEAEYQAVQERNNAIQTNIDELSTSEGIEDRAREEFGWVKEGENAVNVFGIEKEAEEASYTQSVPAGSIEAPNSWYTPVLDALFGVE